MIDTTLISLLLSDIQNLDYYNLVRNDFEKEFQGEMPSKYYIFSIKPNVYTLSHEVCIEMPSWGSILYRNKLNLVEKRLRFVFEMDTIFYDGKVTYVIRGERRCPSI